MKKKRQSTILNAMMVIAIAVIAFSGIMIAGSMKQNRDMSPDTSPEPTLKISDVSEPGDRTRKITEENKTVQDDFASTYVTGDTGENGITLDEPVSVTVIENEPEIVVTESVGTGSAAESAPCCTLEIVCGTVLNNLEDLREGKEAFVPSNGIILAASTIEFESGETVFDVLKEACALADIQLEYSWTPLYDSYYIEGINNLYEFDCGDQSGWMYKVNGVFPNYGCSEYSLSDGDTIVFCYTCEGLGADVGGSVY